MLSVCVSSSVSSSVVTGGGRHEWIIVDELGLFGVDDDGRIGSNQIKSIVVNGWWRGMACHGMIDCYI